MKLSTDVLCTRYICLRSNRLVSRVVSFLIYVQSELKPTDLIFSSPKIVEERSREERIGEEWIRANKSGEKRSGKDLR